jgi:hypothetical protein
VLRGVSKEEIRRLRVVDFFVDSEIVAIQRRYNVISIVTRANSVFNAHEKMKAFNVFKKVKHPVGSDANGDKNHKGHKGTGRKGTGSRERVALPPGPALILHPSLFIAPCYLLLATCYL